MITTTVGWIPGFIIVLSRFCSVFCGRSEFVGGLGDGLFYFLGFDIDIDSKVGVVYFIVMLLDFSRLLMAQF